MIRPVRRKPTLEFGRRLLLAVALISVLAQAPAAQTAARAGWAGERLLSGAEHAWEPFVAADPNSSNVYATWFLRHGPALCPKCSTSSGVFVMSSDDGSSWSRPVYCPFCRLGSKGDYDLTIKVVKRPPRGSPAPVYVMWMDWNSTAFSKSTDYGKTWSPETIISGPKWSDHPWFGMSADGKDVYAFWTHAHGYLYTVSSHDHGATWSRPQQISTIAHRYYYAEGVVVLADGTVVTAAAGYPCGSGSPKCTGQITYNIFRSTDEGAAYTQSVIDTLYTGPQFMTDGLETVAADAAGTLVMMYTGAASLRADNQVHVRRSVDEGVRWSTSIPLTGSGNSADFSYPAITGAGAGSFRATFMDDRAGKFNVRYRQSSDGGITWSREVRISTATSGAPYVNANGFGAPYGDYSGISVLSSGCTIAIWGESAADQRPPGGVWMNRSR
ncbi:MAG: sialidase family protein [Steroidobacteraceae bacterium]